MTTTHCMLKAFFLSISTPNLAIGEGIAAGYCLIGSYGFLSSLHAHFFLPALFSFLRSLWSDFYFTLHISLISTHYNLPHFCKSEHGMGQSADRKRVRRLDDGWLNPWWVFSGFSIKEWVLEIFPSAGKVI